MKLIKLYTVIFFLLLSFSIKADEIKLNKNTEFNIYTGMFDFSDDKKSSKLFAADLDRT